MALSLRHVAAAAAVVGGAYMTYRGATELITTLQDKNFRRKRDRTIFIARVLICTLFRRLIRGPRRPRWTIKLEVLMAIMNEAPPPKNIHSLRRGAELVSPLPKWAQVRWTSVAGLEAAWFRGPTCPAVPVAAPNAVHPVVLYLHGGGYCMMSVRTHRTLISRIARACGGECLAIEYRLAPEHPYPAGMGDAIAAYRHLINDLNIDPKRIVIGGDSAGGGLTMSTLLSLRELGEPLPAAAVLLSPWVDLTCSRDSWRRAKGLDYLSKEDESAGPARLDLPRFYAGSLPLTHPHISPLNASLHNLPPMLVQLGGVEALLDEGEEFVARAREHGVEVQSTVFEDMPHVFQGFGESITGGAANVAFREIGEFIKARCGSASSASSTGQANL